MVSLLTFALGFFSNVLFSVWREKRSTPIIATYGFHFDGFPKAIQSLIFGEVIPDDTWASAFTGDNRYLFDNLRCYVFFLHNTGTTTVRDLKVKAYAKDGSGISYYKFNVEKLIVCDRLSTEKEEDKSIMASWKYLNPGDFIEFYVVATGANARADVAIDVDGDGVSIRETFPVAPIKLMNPLRSVLSKLGNDKLLAKYLELLIWVKSYEDDDTRLEGDSV